MPPGQIVGYPEKLVHQPDSHPFAWVGAQLQRRGMMAPFARRCVGVEMDSHYFSPKAGSTGDGITVELRVTMEMPGFETEPDHPAPMADLAAKGQPQGAPTGRFLTPTWARLISSG